ncbi:hypothetical protein J4732_12910 [Serratia marcescens]|uniref:Aspartate/glutamate/uridylate kinase domain-containing protein n=1 Tax=Serratia marcescens TaxID=615 RepID=A0A939NL37_SERMA|nr:hypothetical protein [Serratia marcescens]
MSTLLFVEILRPRNAGRMVRRAQSDAHRRSLRAVPDSAALSELARAQLQPRLQEALVVTGLYRQRAERPYHHARRGGSDYTAALLGEALGVGRVDIWTDVPGITHRSARGAGVSASIKSVSKKRRKWPPSAPKSCTPPCCRRCAATFRFCRLEQDPAAGGTLVCNTTENPPLFRALALRRKQTLLTLHSLNMLHARGFWPRCSTFSRATTSPSI